MLKFTLIPFKVILTVITALAAGFAYAYRESALFRGIMQVAVAPVIARVKALKEAYGFLTDFTAGVEKLLGKSGKEVKTKEC